ncbi:MAG: TrkA family potassium uptake protein [Chloroflexi bacterium]|nr:TrkA family potassium uptake protein [Chloroflexota bacterium]
MSKSRRQFAVLGLGRFGSHLAFTLAQKGYRVLGLDHNEKMVDSICDCVTMAKVLDCTNTEALREAGVANCDVAILCIGNSIEASILALVALQELKVPYIIAKAQNDVHGRVLSKMGAHEVVNPEKDMAIRLANRLTFSNLLDFIELSPDYSLAEEKVPPHLVGKSLSDLDLLHRSRISIVAIKRNDHLLIAPSADERIQTGDAIVLIGSTEAVNSFLKE